jgi:hypothetical protein
MFVGPCTASKENYILPCHHSPDLTSRLRRPAARVREHTEPCARETYDSTFFRFGSPEDLQCQS